MWKRAMIVLAVVIIFATALLFVCFNAALGAQHCINIDVHEKVAMVSYSSPDLLGAIAVMLDLGDCVIEKVKWGNPVPGTSLDIIYIDGNQLSVGCFGISPAIPSGQNVKLLKVYLDKHGCAPDTFTNTVGFGTAMVRTDASRVDVDINFLYTGVSDDEDEFGIIPDEFSIGTYPNPFNPSMMIRYSVPERNVVRIAVYNLLGQEVTCLTDSEHVPGTYYISWDARQASGTYFIRMSAPEFSEVKKVLLLK